MRAIDTNLLVRLLVRDDARQVEAAEKFSHKGARVSTIALVETLWVLDAVYDRSSAQISAAVERLLTHTALKCPAEFLRETWIAFSKHDEFMPSISERK